MESQIKQNLLNSAMKAKWNDVRNIYRANPSAHNFKITKSGDTALHIAVSDGQEEIVQDLVALIGEKEPKDLRIKNDQGNTPLHLAASMGNVKMCDDIASADPSSVGVRNLDSETPLFLAALHGQKGAFLRLHQLCGSNGSNYCRRNDGETILHVAIAGDYFELAFHIIRIYKELVNAVNERGFSPLHLLATKPSAFKSGSHLTRCSTLIYHCIFVDELKAETNDTNSIIKTFKEEKDPKYPENYQTCVNFFRMLREVVYVGIRRNTTPSKRKPDEENRDVQPASANVDKDMGEQSTRKAQAHELLPPNYTTCFEFIKFVCKAVLVVLGFGSTWIRKIRAKKENNIWSVQIMNEMLSHARQYGYEDNGKSPKLSLPTAPEEDTKPYTFLDGGTVEISTFVEQDPLLPTTSNHSQLIHQQLPNNGPNAQHTNGRGDENQKTPLLTAKNNCDTEIVEKIRNFFPMTIYDMKDEKQNSVALAGEKKETLNISKKETPILIAAKNGVTEMVQKILELFPVAIHDMNAEKKNIVLLAVENRQPHVYKLLLNGKILRENIFRKVDESGNSALHLAAMLGNFKPWMIPGAALQMQWELKWYEFVKSSMPHHFFVRYNKHNKTPKEIFSETHQDLVKSGGEWLTNTSQSCSVVAALIATVAFATSSTVPGGVKEESGIPTLDKEPAFKVFSISSLIALCFSVTSVVLFLSILTSRYQERDFGKDLPRKLLLGLSSLFVSIAAMLISFCAGHFFMLKDELKYAAFPLYIATCLPATLFAVAQFPLYFDLVWATLKKVPQRSYTGVPL